MVAIRLNEPPRLTLARNGGTVSLYPSLGVGPSGATGPRGPAGPAGTGGTGGTGTASFPTYPTLAAAQTGLANGEFSDGDIIVIGP